MRSIPGRSSLTTCACPNRNTADPTRNRASRFYSVPEAWSAARVYTLRAAVLRGALGVSCSPKPSTCGAECPPKGGEVQW